MKVTEVRKGLLALGGALVGGVLLLLAYGALIEFSCRKPRQATEAVHRRLRVGMNLHEVLAAAERVEGAHPSVASGAGVNGPLRLWIASGLECECYVPIDFVAGRVINVSDPVFW